MLGYVRILDFGRYPYRHLRNTLLPCCCFYISGCVRCTRPWIPVIAARSNRDGYQNGATCSACFEAVILTQHRRQSSCLLSCARVHFHGTSHLFPVPMLLNLAERWSPHWAAGSTQACHGKIRNGHAAPFRKWHDNWLLGKAASKLMCVIDACACECSGL